MKKIKVISVFFVYFFLILFTGTYFGLDIPLKTLVIKLAYTAPVAMITSLAVTVILIKFTPKKQE